MATKKQPPAKNTGKSPAKPVKASKGAIAAKKSTSRVAARPAAKAPAKPASAKAAKAPEKKPALGKKAPPPAPEKKSGVAKAVAPPPPPPPVVPATPDASKSGGKRMGGSKSRRAPGKSVVVVPIIGEALLKPGERPPKPLIPSGPNAPPPERLLGPAAPGERKSPYNKKELERFRNILLQKRAELVGDINHMEGEALLGGSGSLSHLPQHMAEQGSEAYDQALSLDLAAADRKLLKEIDDALQRIKDGTYGLCELTGKPIKAERLEELPWARHSIEAARQLERRSFHP